jgi:hypothetical protein
MVKGVIGGEAGTMKLRNHYKMGVRIYQSLYGRNMPVNRFCFLLGNLIPDLSLSFLYRPHEYEPTASRVKNLIRRLSRGRGNPGSALFAFLLGISCHYVCDYFCYSHHPSFKGGFIGHIRYENSQTAGDPPEDPGDSDPGFPKPSRSADMLDEYLLDHHRRRSQKSWAACNDIPPAVLAASRLASAVYRGAEESVKALRVPEGPPIPIEPAGA